MLCHAYMRLFQRYGIEILEVEESEGGERLQEARWLVFKAMLDEFPKLRERARRYLKKSLSPKGELFLSREDPQAVVFEEQA